ncbi:MAG: YlxR family protein [Mogibacterium sp.]|nr:YlxR family protein [Mogibacterium sp.]
MRRHKTTKPMRRCIACRESKPQDELIRFVLNGHDPVVDIDGRAEGRGFYLCKSAECAKTAVKRKAFNRVCKRNLDENEISSLIEQALNSYQGGMDVKES